MISYTLPGLMEFADINLFFIEVARARPDMLFPNVAPKSVYGGFAGCRLCGGRNNPGQPLPIQAVEQRIARYNQLGIGCNVTFTNQLATADMLQKTSYDWQVLEALSAGQGNGVITYSDELAKKIKQVFPNLTLTASTTKALSSACEIDSALQLYDRVVPDYGLTKDETFFANYEHASRLEVMVNEYCTPHCPYRHKHYAAVSQAQLDGAQTDFVCKHQSAPQNFGFLQGLINGDVFLRNEDAWRYAQEYGVGSFKIVGRGLARYDIVDSYLYYLIQPDCWYEVRDFLIHHDFF